MTEVTLLNDTKEMLNTHRVVLETRLLKSMQDSLYSNRLRIAPRRIREVAHEEITALIQFVTVPNWTAAAERGRQLVREGLGQRAIIDTTSVLRLTVWEIASCRPTAPEIVALLEEYTSALISGYMAAYEEDQRLEQQRTHDALVRSLTKA